MSWSEVLFRWRKPAIALAIVYATGAAIGIVGSFADDWPPGDVGSFYILGISVRGLFQLAFATLAKLIIALGTLAIGIKVLTESLADTMVKRMNSEGPK